MISTKALKILEDTRELLSEPSHWTKGENARDVNGHHAGESTAVCWCLIGALAHVAIKVVREYNGADIGYNEAKGVIRSVIAFDYYPNIVVWNDAPERTHDEIMAVLDKAIVKAKEIYP